MAYSNDSKPTGSFTNESMPFFLAQGTLMFTVPLLTYPTNTIGSSFSNDTKPTGTYSNDSKP